MNDSIYSDQAVRDAIAAECRRATVAALTAATQEVTQATNIMGRQAIEIAELLIEAGCNTVTPAIRLLLADYEDQRRKADDAAAREHDMREQLYSSL